MDQSLGAGYGFDTSHYYWNNIISNKFVRILIDAEIASSLFDIAPRNDIIVDRPVFRLAVQL